MKTIELADLLKREGYDHRWYSFDRAAPPIEGYILESVHGRWIIFYFERGETRDIANFELESDACDYLYRRMQQVYGPKTDP